MLDTRASAAGFLFIEFDKLPLQHNVRNTITLQMLVPAGAWGAASKIRGWIRDGAGGSEAVVPLLPGCRLEVPGANLTRGRWLTLTADVGMDFESATVVIGVETHACHKAACPDMERMERMYLDDLKIVGGGEERKPFCPTVQASTWLAGFRSERCFAKPTADMPDGDKPDKLDDDGEHAEESSWGVGTVFFFLCSLAGCYLGVKSVLAGGSDAEHPTTGAAVQNSSADPERASHEELAWYLASVGQSKFTSAIVERLRSTGAHHSSWLEIVRSDPAFVRAVASEHSATNPLNGSVAAVDEEDVQTI